MIEHPGVELQVLIREKNLTQKAFSSILGKKVSEVNELLKGKRNITIQRDYLLHQTLGTPIKYWILKQIDYDYSLLKVEDSNVDSSGVSMDNPARNANESKIQDFPSSLDSSLEGQTKLQETPTQESTKQDNEDLKNRAKIFRSF